MSCGQHRKTNRMQPCGAGVGCVSDSEVQSFTAPLKRTIFAPASAVTDAMRAFLSCDVSFCEAVGLL